MSLKKIIDKLNKNCMYQLSLCSNEEFHSNYLKWLMEKDSKFVKIFYPEFNLALKE